MTTSLRSHPLARIVAACLLALALSSSAQAHDDPPAHYLETDLLYPAFAARPSLELELQLVALLSLSASRGYPIKVALVGTEDDLVDPEMLGQPQRYAEFVATVLAETRVLKAPVVVVTPFGVGVGGVHRRDGRSVTVSAEDARALVGSIQVPAGATGDDLARTALAEVRQLATAAGRALPANVPVPSAYVPRTSEGSGPAGPGGDDPMAWFPVIFFAIFFGAWLAFEARRFVSGRGRS